MTCIFGYLISQEALVLQGLNQWMYWSGVARVQTKYIAAKEAYFFKVPELHPLLRYKHSGIHSFNYSNSSLNIKKWPNHEGDYRSF